MSERHSHDRTPARAAGRMRMTRWLALLLGGLLGLLALAAQVHGFAPVGSVAAAPAIYRHAQHAQDASDTPTPSPPPVIPPTLALAVPSSGQGPVGANLTVTGSNWGSADVAMGLAAPGGTCVDPSGWTQTLNHVRPQPNETIIFTFSWPSGLTATSGPYFVCATNSNGTADVAYQVLATAPPSLAVDSRTANVHDLVTVTGANFVGSGNVALTVTDGTGKTRTLTTLSPDSTGAFSLQYQPQPGDVGDEVLHATSTNTPQGMTAALEADAKLHVGDAPTPTVEATVSAPVVVTPTQNSGGGGSTLLIVVLVIGFLLALAVVAGVALFFILRRRNQPGDDGAPGSPYFGGGSGYSGHSGYGQTGYGAGVGMSGGMGGVDGWDAPTQGYQQYPQGQEQYGGEQYGGDYGDPNGWPRDDEPDPNWRPRPMTGQWRASEGYPDQSYGGGGYGAGESGRYPPQDPQYPQDPWGSPDDSYGQPPQQGRGGYPGGPGGAAGGYSGNYPPQQSQGGYPPQSGGSRPGSRPGSQGGYPQSGPRGRGGSSGGSGSRDPRDPSPYDDPHYPQYPDQPPGNGW